MVSIIIPTYNRADVITRSINSILEQTYQNFEVWVVDDASTDDTDDIVTQIEDSRVHYVKCEKRVGANGARNIGIQNSQGDYLAFQDSDDVWEKNKLAEQINFFREHEDIDVLFCRYSKQFINGMQEVIPDSRFSETDINRNIEDILAGGNVIGTPTMIARRKCFVLCGMFDENIPRFQDWELALRFVQKSKIAFLDKVLVRAYEMEESITRSCEKQIDAMMLILKKHTPFFENKGMLDKHLGNLVELALLESSIEKVMETLGADMFFRGIYQNHKRNVVIKKNYELVKRWLKKQNNEKTINSFFDKFDNYTLAVYGMGELGRLTFALLTEENKKKIKFLIDRNKYITSDLEIKVIDEIEEKEFNDLECIFITAIAHEDVIRNMLLKRTNIKLVSLSDIINLNR